MAEPDRLARSSRRGALGLLGAAALLAAGCAPTVVAGTEGGPFATTAPSATPTPSAPPSSATPSPTPSTPSPTPSTPSPTPTPSVPPLAGDSISLNDSTLSFLAPGPPTVWVKTLAVGSYSQNRTFYDDYQTGLHVTVEVDLPLGLTPLEHARELNLDKQTTEEGYHLLALQSGPLDGATWAFTSTTTGSAQYVIDWFFSYPAFDAAILVSGPPAAKPLVKALWLEIVKSAFVPIPYSTATPSSTPSATRTATTSSSADTSSSTTGDGSSTTGNGATLPAGLANGGTG